MFRRRPFAAQRMRAARRDRLRRALAQQSPHDRAIFQLVIADRSSLKDAATVLAIPVALLEEQLVELLLRLERVLRGDVTVDVVPD